MTIRDERDVRRLLKIYEIGFEESIRSSDAENAVVNKVVLENIRWILGESAECVEQLVRDCEPGLAKLAELH